MSDSFDAYYKWLAIPPEEQPPNHYRLLGIPLHTDDPDVISHAADRQMAHIRSFQVGNHAAESQHILNELANARVCLLNPNTKCQYDDQLRAKSPVREPEMKTASPLPLPQATPLPPPNVEPPVRPVAYESAVVAEPTPAIHAQPHHRGKRRNSQAITLLAVASLAGFFVVALIAWMAFQPSRSESPPIGQPQLVDAAAPINTNDESTDDKPDPFAYRDEPKSPPNDSPPDSGQETEDESQEPTDTVVPDSPDATDELMKRQIERLTAQRQAAVDRGDLTAALAVTEQMAVLVGGDPVAMKIEIIATRSKAAETPEEYRLLATNLLAIMENALADEKVQLERPLQDELLSLARNSGDNDLVRKATLCVLKIQQRGASDSADDESLDPGGSQ